MKKSSAVVSLVFLGSLVVAGGCSRKDEEDKNQATTGHRSGGVYLGRPGVRSGRGATATPSARGGFGGTGHGAVGS